MKQKLSVVMPVRNEQDAVGTVLEKWSRELYRLGVDFRIDVYNDGSNDNTLAVLNSVAQKLPQVVIHNKLNSGHGPTLLLGYQQNTDCEWIFQIDSDDEIQPEHFEQLWSERDHYDFLAGRRSGRGRSAFRRSISLFARLTVWGLYGQSISDVNVPYRLMRTEKFKTIFHALSKKIFAPNVIISGWAARRGLRILEKDVFYHHRKNGTSSMGKWRLLELAMRSFIQVFVFRWSGDNT